MPNNDNIHEDALPKLAEGVRKAAAIVAQTMGPKGKNVDVQTKLYPYHQVNNDGATILKAIELADPIEAIGLSYLKEAADRSNGNSGDGSSTTTVLLDAMLQEGIKTGNSTLEIKQSLDECLPIIERSITEQTRQITVEDIPAVARIAGENEELAKTLGQIYKTIGKDGIIHLEGSGTYETSFSLIEGVRFADTGFLSPDLAYDEQAEKDGRTSKRAVYQNPTILITKNKIERDDDINPLLGALIARGDKTLVIFTDDMESKMAKKLIELQKEPKRSINVLIIKAPWLWKTYVYEDFAKITGATIIEDSTGTSLGKRFNLDWLGTCETLICDKEETTVIGIKDISEHIRELESDGSEDSKRRLSWLTTKTAVLKLGAKSETELSYLRLKAEDAIFSSRAALKHGIVAGGGSCLWRASQFMPDTIGGNILRVALLAPMNQIIENAGNPIPDNYHNEAGEVMHVKDIFTTKKIYHHTDSIGFDAKNNKITDMFEDGIVDAASIVLGAVRNSLGIASTLLTTSSVITLPPEKEIAVSSPFPF